MAVAMVSLPAYPSDLPSYKTMSYTLYFSESYQIFDKIQSITAGLYTIRLLIFGNTSVPFLMKPNGEWYIATVLSQTFDRARSHLPLITHH